MDTSGTQTDQAVPAEIQQKGHRNATREAQEDSGLRSAWMRWSLLLVLAGTALQGYANGTADSLVWGVFLLLAGYWGVRLAFRPWEAEVRAFLLGYAVCVFAGGLAQCYSLFAFGEIQSTVDAVGFFEVIFPQPPYFSWTDLSLVVIDGSPVGRGAPLAVALWQWLYRFRHLLGLDFGVYIGVMFNAWVMGLTASLTVRTAREVFGDDPWRLRRVGTLFAFCGLFILFGAILLRDSFTTFLNALVLWGAVRWLVRPSLRTLVFAGAVTAFSVSTMAFLRFRSIVMFGFIWFLAGATWFLGRRMNAARLLAAFLVVLALLAGSSYLVDYLQASLGLRAKGTESYQTILAAGSQEGSIGMQLVVNQPLPIRLIAGTVYLLLFPIPLWAYFHAGVGEYHFIKGYNGIYQIFVVPLVLAGIGAVLKRSWQDRNQLAILRFLLTYLLLNVLAVVATSMEQRHVAQFLPAFMILAALPDTREVKTRNQVWGISMAWILMVALVQLAWALVATGR